MSVTVLVDEIFLRKAEAATGIGEAEELVRLGLEKLAVSSPLEHGIPLHPQLYAAWEAARSLPSLDDPDAEAMERHLRETGRMTPPWSA